VNDFILVINGLLRKKFRTILLILSILTAFLIFGVLGAFFKAWNAGTDTAAADRLVTVNKINFTVSMPYAYLNKIRAVDGVKNVTQASWFGGYFQDPRNIVQTFAVDPESYLQAYPELIFPDDQAQAFITRRDCLAAGIDIAKKNNWSVGDTIPLKSNIWQKSDGSDAWQFYICAIFDGEKPNVPANYAFFQYDYFNEDLAFGRDMIGWFIVSSGDPQKNDAVAKQIDELFANSRAETETSSEAAFNKAFLAQFGNISLILTLVIGAAFVTILAIVGTTMVMAVAERTKEIAVMKTLGFQTGRIFRLILAESLALSLFGGLIGLTLSALLVNILAGLMAGMLPGMVMTPSIIIFAISFMIILGLATGILPALKAMNIKIVDALGKS